MPFFNIDKKLIYKISAVVIPALFIILSLVFTTYLKNIYENTENELIAAETKFASFELSENLRRTIMYRAKILEIVSKARPDIFPKNHESFKNIVSVIMNNLPGFYAINWVNPEGEIVWILPESGNKVAIKKNVLNRKEVTQYLLAAKEEKTAKISHVIDLYQGPKGLIIYVPIYDGNTFKGWYNGVISIQESFDRFFERRKIKTLHVSVKFKGHDSYAYTYGQPTDGTKKINFESDVLNQTLSVEVSFNKTSSTGKRSEQLKNVFNFIYISIVIIAAFLFYLIRSQFAFMNLNKKLTRDRTLINILSHDMASPLTLITENTKRLKEKLKDQNYPEVDRILRSSEKQMNLLTRVRSFHATNIGKIHIELLPTSVPELISESLTTFEDALKEKEITCTVENPEGELFCLTDRMTTVDNVLGNVISNAIKFSNNNSKISIRSYSYDSKYLVIEIEDQGTGIPKSVLAHLFDENESTSRKGTKGETGTGLGMLQIKAFMEYYKGYVKIHTSERGTIVQLYFRSADLKL